METPLISRRCPLCGENRGKVFYTDFSYEHHGVPVFQCNGCDILYTSHWPGPEWIEEKYRNTYDSFERNDPLMRSQIAESSLATMVAEITRMSPTPGRLLDLGCGGGLFLRLAQKNGWEVFGIELSAHACEQLRQKFGITVHNGNLENATWPDSYFDVITLWEVLEHLIEPVQQLLLVNRKLKLNGLLGVSTPNSDYYRYKVLLLGRLYSAASKAIWPHPYEHVQYFSLESLKSILNKTGFEIITARASDHMTSCDVKASAVLQSITKIYLFLEQITRRLTVNKIALCQGWTVYARKVKNL